MTANRTARRALGVLSALAVVAGAALLVVAPPSGAALSDPGVYGLVLLGAAVGLLAALATLAATDTPPADRTRPAPGGAGAGGAPAADTADPTPEAGRRHAGEPGSDPSGEPAGGPAAEPGADAAAEGATAGTDSVDSVQELFEQVADEEPGSLVDEDAAEGEFLFGGDRDRE